MDPSTLIVLDRIMQWLIIPAIVFTWRLNSKQNTQETEIKRILTILEERDKRRVEDNQERDKRRLEDREDSVRAIARLETAISSIGSKLDRFLEELRNK
jgi:hypothetical protein